MRNFPEIYRIFVTWIFCEPRKMTDSPQVIIPNPERYKEIVSKLVEGGVKRLQVISDFDNTITAIGSPQSWSAVESFPEFSQVCHLLPVL